MADKSELLAEAYRRGILPPQQKAAYEEAMRRGVVQSPTGKALMDARARSASTPGMVRTISQAGTFNLSDELDANIAGLETGARNFLSRVGIGQGAGYTADQARAAVMQSEKEALDSFAKDHPVQNVIGTIVGGIANPGNRVGAGLVGKALAPGAKVARAAAVGGATGAAYGAGGGEGVKGRALGAAMGAGVGTATGMVLQGGANKLAEKAATKALAPKTDARKLAEAGVELTPGQIAGGIGKRVEDAATSIPVTGDAIRNAQSRGVESFDRVVIDRVLEPIGGKLPDDVKVGRDGVKFAREQVSAAYKKALSGVNIQADETFLQQVADVANTKLRGSAADEVATAVDDIRATFANGITGTELKEVDGLLGMAIRSAPEGPVGRAQQRALIKLQDSLDELLGRASPEALAGKTQADAAFAQLVRLEDAAGRVGARDGIFTPSQLQSAVRAKEGVKRKFAAGDALMQDLSDPAVNVMPSTVPDSGTAFRSLFGANAPAALLGIVSGIPGQALYSKPVVGALNQIYRSSSPGQVEAGLSQLQALAAREPALQPLAQEILHTVRAGQTVEP